MLTIRAEQMECLGKYMRQRFENRMVKHLRTNFPEQTRALDQAGLRELVLFGINRAEGYGLAFEDDIQRYLEYMMVLSRDFDTNPRTSWAGNILRADLVGVQKLIRIDKDYLFARRWAR